MERSGIGPAGAGRKLARREIAKRAVRADFIVMHAPVLEQHVSGVDKAEEAGSVFTLAQIINEPPSGVFINKENNSQEPLIFAELDTEIEELTVVDALEKMKLGNASALMFRNSKHSGLNMIYKREDGLIGWVDPRGNRELAKV